MDNIQSLFITFKITLKCNLACQYCYGRDNNSIKAEMTDLEIRTGLQFVYKYALAVGAKSLMICWHGGEPLLLSERLLSIIDYADKLFQGNGIVVRHSAQTNATLLTTKTYPLIRKHFNGHIGVSIDLFSSYRTFKSGKVSTPIAIANIDKALANGIRCSAINLITKDNLNFIPEIYEFYKKRSMNVRLARAFPISKDDALDSPMYVSDEEYADAMIRFFDFWANDSAPAYNTDIVKLVADLLLGVPSICLREKACHRRYLALSPGGDIFSCAEFDVPEAVIGNFLTDIPEQFATSDARDRLAFQAPIPDECNSCRYLPTCHGGCLRERFMLGYPYRCRSNKIYWDHVVKWIEGKGAALYILKDKNSGEKYRIINEIFRRSS